MKRRQRKPPPNYFSRSVQLRLLIVVSALMLVIVMMFEARDPRNWQWMWQGVEAVPLEGEDEVDTRLEAEPAPSDPPGTVYADDEADAAALAPDQPLADGQPGETLRIVMNKAWRHVSDDLSFDERTALDQLLKAARQDTPLDDAALADWTAAYAHVQDRFQHYLDAANDEVMLARDRWPPAQKEALLNALRELEVMWSGQLQPALRAPLDGRYWTQLERDLLAAAQSVLDEIALTAIRDDTVWRPGETAAWFRLFERLLTTGDRQLARQAERVGFLQLFEQSADYRGRPVTFSGTARLAYRVRAPRNIHGIEAYYVFWVRPRGGPNSPLVVYALETPDGFPAIKDKDLDGETTTLEEDLEFTGFFFKRWAYRAQDGLHTAPLLLAKRPVWQSATTAGGTALPSMTVAVLSVAAIAALAIGLAYLAWRTGAGPTAADVSSTLAADRDELQALRDREVLPGPEENLRRMARQEQERTHRDESPEA